MEDVMNQISIAELKLIDKELEKLVLKLHEDEEWLIIKPLTYESSKKYGAGTKWCTAADNEDYQFYNYTNRGILIYTINKKFCLFRNTFYRFNIYYPFFSIIFIIFFNNFWEIF